MMKLGIDCMLSDSKSTKNSANASIIYLVVNKAPKLLIDLRSYMSNHPPINKNVNISKPPGNFCSIGVIYS